MANSDKPFRLLPINVDTQAIKLSPDSTKKKKASKKPTSLKKTAEPVTPQTKFTKQEPSEFRNSLSPLKPEPSFDKTVSRFRNLLPDFDALTASIIDSDLDQSKALEIEQSADDMVDWAPNVVVFCADKRFLGMRPFAKQAEILTLLFEDYCPNCTDMSYLVNVPTHDSLETFMSRVTLLNYGKCPSCSARRGSFRTSGQHKSPQELIAIVGQRAGKSVTAAMAIAYLVHWNLRIGTPWKVYGLSPGQVVDFTIVATKMGQAEKTLWGTLKGLVTTSPWFSNYAKLCNEEGKKRGVKETVRFTETFILFDHKKVLIYFAANDPSGLRGTTRFGFGIDEYAFFDAEEGSGRVRANGPETYTSLNNSLMTLRLAYNDAVKLNPDIDWPYPLGLNISSPRAQNDPIMALYRRYIGNPRVVRRIFPTWEFNPKATKEFLYENYGIGNPNFSRDFGASPPLTDDPLVENPIVVQDLFKTPVAVANVVAPVALGEVFEIDTGRALQLSAKLADHDFPQRACEDPAWQDMVRELERRPLSARSHVFGIDLGSTNNAMGVVGGCLVRGKFITTFACEVKPRSDRGVNIASVYDELIVPLVNKFHGVAVFYDRWQGLHQIQDLAKKFGSPGPLNSKADHRNWKRDLAKRGEAPRFVADQYSLSVADAKTLVGRLEQGECLFPSSEMGMMELLTDPRLKPEDYPYTHLMLQMCTVRARGIRLLKPLSGDDDLFRAWANAAFKALTDETVIGLLTQEGPARPVATKLGMHRPSHVSMGSVGKGLRRTESAAVGTLSHSTTAGMPVVVKRGALGAQRRHGERNGQD